MNLRKTLDHAVLDVRFLTESAFVLRFERAGLEFVPGQHVSVGPHSDLDMREYSIYSGNNDDALEILVKEIPGGAVSPKLKKLRAGERIKVEGPFGFFVLQEHEKNLPLYCVATGTGIAPFHCFAASHADARFTVLHGIRSEAEQYERGAFAAHTYIACISGSGQTTTNENAYSGRVTSYLRERGVNPDGVYFLCGNCDMIYETYDILHAAGVSSERIKAEVYF